MQDDGNGTAEASPNSAAQGAEVTITATPNSGYSFESWQVVSGGVTLSHSTANPAKFTMPGNAVTIKAIFAEIPPNTPSLSLTPPEFDDVTIGYAAQPTKNVTIKNDGTGTANITSIELDSNGNTAFTLGNTSITAVAAGGTAVFTVQPKTGLAAGTYEGAITVTYDSGKKAEAEISFTVNNTTFNVANADEWNDAVTAISGGGNNETYDINVTGEFSIPGYSSSSPTFGDSYYNDRHITVNIRGAGTITLAAGSTGSLLNIGKNQTVSLKDTHLKGHSTNDTSLVYVQGTLNMTGGTISGNNSDGYINWIGGGSAGGVFVSNGTFNMSGGTISDNTNTAEYSYGNYGNGGGVAVGNGTFTMSGTAMISGNKAEGNGGGVYISAGTDFSSTFTMTGGTITGNTAKRGGGIGNGNVDNGSGGWTNGSTFINITGGIISDNNVDERGGGIYLYGDGGDIEVTLNMSGTAEIRENIAGTGGGVFLDTGGSFTMSGGIITGNSARVGGGVEVYSGGTFDLKSFDLVKNNTITNNTRGVQVYVLNNSTFLINGSPPDPSLNSNDYAWQ
jgi:hypothetical protein